MAEKPDAMVRAKNANRVMETSPVFASYYANDTQVQTSPWDVRLTFGVMKEVNVDENRIVIEKQADVRISLQHAKKIAMILTQQIQQYEATLGPLALPPD